MFTFSDDRNEKFAYFIGSAENFCLFPGIDWIKENHVLVCIKLFISKADKICPDFSGFLIIETIYGFISRVGYFLCVFGKLDLRCKFGTVCIFDSSKFVYTAECRVIVGGDQSCSDTPGINLGILSLQALNEIFVQIAGSGNNCIVKSGSSKHLICFFGKVGKITTVDTDTVFGKRNTFFAHFLKYTNCIWNTGFQDIIGIYQ